MRSDTEVARAFGFDIDPGRPFWPRVLIAAGFLTIVALTAYAVLRPVVR